MTLSVTYNPLDWIGVRFIDNFRFATKKDIRTSSENFPPNLAERISHVALWLVEEFPCKVWKVLKDPRIVSLAVTILALGVTSLAFYPATTVHVIRHVVQLLPKIPFWAVKFATYITICETILAYGLRAQARFWNEKLRNAFYNQRIA